MLLARSTRSAAIKTMHVSLKIHIEPSKGKGANRQTRMMTIMMSPHQIISFRERISVNRQSFALFYTCIHD